MYLGLSVPTEVSFFVILNLFFEFVDCPGHSRCRQSSPIFLYSGVRHFVSGLSVVVKGMKGYLCV